MGADKGTHCAKGHLFDAMSADGKRQRCMKCERARLVAWRKKRKEEKQNALVRSL